MKKHLFLIVSALVVSGVAQAGQAPQFGDIVRNSDGSILYMSQFDAVDYCANQGMHLPSARELAQLSQSLGARGIKEDYEFPGPAAYYNPGYIPVNGKNSDGKIDSFYFDFHGYNRPAGDLGNNWFWSSSVNRYYIGDAFILDGRDGDVFRFPQSVSHVAVRCVAGQ